MIPIGEENDGITSASRGPRALTTNIFNWLDAGHGGGEESQIQRNDGLLKAIMRFAGIPNLPDNFVRNKTTDTTSAQRPDFAALFRRVSLSRRKKTEMHLKKQLLTAWENLHGFRI
jgi:hypothetical protein